jgi:trigger factor
MSDATPPPAVEESKYDIKIEEVGPAKKRLTITVPASVIDEKIEESLGTLMAQTSLPGFRKGRAPKALLERRFGTTVRAETKNQVIADGYASAIEEHSIRPVGEPEPDEALAELEIEEGKPLTFSVEVEVAPEFDMPELDGIEIKKPILEVGDDQIAQEIERQCMQAGEVAPVTEKFTKGDRLVGPGTVTIDGEEEPFFTHEHMDIMVPGDEDGGRGPVLGLMVDGLAQTLAKKKAGDDLEFKLVGPDAHEREEIRGKNITISMNIREAQRLNPATLETVLERYGMPSEDILKEQIKLALEQKRDEEQRAAMREQVHKQLVTMVEFDLPEQLTAQQATRILEQYQLDLQYRGVEPAEVERLVAEARSSSEEESRRRLKLSFILAKLAQDMDVQVSEQEVNGRIAAIAVQRGMRPDQLRTELVQQNMLPQIASQLREHKTADRVIDKAKVEEISAEEWNKLVEADQASKSGSKKTTKKKSTTKKKTTKKKTIKSTDED